MKNDIKVNKTLVVGRKRRGRKSVRWSEGERWEEKEGRR